MERKEYKEIVDKLIKKSFPKLKGKKIFVFTLFYLYKNAIAMVVDFGFFKSIWINTWKTKKFSKKEITAILVHEICHIERNIGKNFFEMVVFHIKYLFSKEKSFNEERKTEILVIKKGYGKNLLNVVRKLEKIRSKERMKKRNKMGYLNSKQIKNYMKKFGK